MTRADWRACSDPSERAAVRRLAWTHEAGPVGGMPLVLDERPDPAEEATQAQHQIRTNGRCTGCGQRGHRPVGPTIATLPAPDPLPPPESGASGTLRTPRKVRLMSRQCAGDALVLTGAIRSLHLQYPGRFQIDVRTNGDALFEHNPDITRFPIDEPDVREVDIEYPLIHQCNQRPIHFLEAFTQELGKQLGVPLECRVNRPVLVLSEEEKGWMGRVEEIVGKPVPYWILIAGGKIGAKDFPTKIPPRRLIQEVVDRLRGEVQFVQIGSLDANHHHPPIEGAIDQRGKTGLRELVRLVYHAHGGLGPTTLALHVAAALGKPWVYLDAPREPAAWTGYPGMTSLVKHGMLPCCALSSCWKMHVTSTTDPEKKSLCDRPVWDGEGWYPRCLEMVTADEVCRAIQGYYRGGRLP